MTEPMRLIDDPRFAAEAGIDLKAAFAAPLSADPARAAAALEGALAASLAPHFDPFAPSWSTRLLARAARLAVPLAFGAGVAVGAAGAVVALRAPAGVVETMPAPTAAFPSASPAPLTPVASPAPLAPVPPLAPPVVAAPKAARTLAPPEEDPTASSARESVSTSLRDEVRVYERARAAVAAGKHAVALAEIDDAIARFPSGRLDSEQRVLRAEVLLSLGRLAEALAEADAVAGLLASRADRTALSVRARASAVAALIALGRCDEARARAGDAAAVDLGVCADP